MRELVFHTLRLLKLPAESSVSEFVGEANTAFVLSPVWYKHDEDTVSVDRQKSIIYYGCLL